MTAASMADDQASMGCKLASCAVESVDTVDVQAAAWRWAPSMAALASACCTLDQLGMVLECAWMCSSADKSASKRCRTCTRRQSHSAFSSVLAECTTCQCAISKALPYFCTMELLLGLEADLLIVQDYPDMGRRQDLQGGALAENALERLLASSQLHVTALQTPICSLQVIRNAQKLKIGGQSSSFRL